MHALVDIALIAVALVLILYYLDVVLEWLLVLGILAWCSAQYGADKVQSWLN